MVPKIYTDLSALDKHGWGGMGKIIIRLELIKVRCVHQSRHRTRREIQCYTYSNYGKFRTAEMM